MLLTGRTARDQFWDVDCGCGVGYTDWFWVYVYLYPVWNAMRRTDGLIGRDSRIRTSILRLVWRNDILWQGGRDEERRIRRE